MGTSLSSQRGRTDEPMTQVPRLLSAALCLQSISCQAESTDCSWGALGVWCSCSRLYWGAEGCLQTLPWHGAGSWEAVGWDGPAEPAQHDRAALHDRGHCCHLTNAPWQGEGGMSLRCLSCSPMKKEVYNEIGFISFDSKCSWIPTS